MLAIGWASVLRGTKRWRDERRNEAIEKERRGPPRVTQAHSRSSGRKLIVGLRMLGFMFDTTLE